MKFWAKNTPSLLSFFDPKYGVFDLCFSKKIKPHIRLKPPYASKLQAGAKHENNNTILETFMYNKYLTQDVTNTTVVVLLSCCLRRCRILHNSA